jgi:hypothetical protein
MVRVEESAGMSIPGEIVEIKSPGIGHRFKSLFIKMLSLKFLAFTVQVFLGIIWFQHLLVTEIANAAAWGVWTGYMVGAFGVYTVGNVGTKKISGYSSGPVGTILSNLNRHVDVATTTASSPGAQ